MSANFWVGDLCGMAKIGVNLDKVLEGEKVDIPSLLKILGSGSSLSINTIRKAELKRLVGLEALPISSLALRWLSAPNLKAFHLPPTLKELRIWHSNKLTSLDGIDAAQDLVQLDLRGNGPLEDATALRDLPKLRNLSITGDAPSLQKISTLGFLNGLPLRHLALRAVDGGLLDLGPVARLSNLETLDLHGPNFAPKELAKVAAAHAWFMDALMELPDYPLQGMACKKCGGKQKELFLKGKKGLWCPTCGKVGLQKALDEFRDLVTASKA